MKEEKIRKSTEAEQARPIADAAATGELPDENLDQVAGGIGSGNQTIWTSKQEKK